MRPRRIGGGSGSGGKQRRLLAQCGGRERTGPERSPGLRLDRSSQGLQFRFGSQPSGTLFPRFEP
jgi:hypothetical protein